MSSYRFDEYRLDSDRRLLSAGNQIIPLSAKTFGVLECLVRACGRTVSKDELVAAVWQSDDASDATIAEHIWLVRKLLNERAGSRKYILTVPRKGYRFIPQVWCETPSDAAGISPPFAAIPPRGEPGVWREYLVATNFAAKRDFYSLKLALKHYNAALKLDQKFSPAWIGIADAYASIAFYAFATWERVLPGALAAIRQAIELDPRSALAHCVLAQLQLAQWDIPESERSLDRAGNLDPQSVAVFALGSFVRAWNGDAEAALNDAKRALAIQPTDLSVHGAFANALAATGELQSAITTYSKILELDPTCRIARQGRCEAYVASGQLDLAIRDLEQLPRTPSNVSRLACVHAFLGDKLTANRLLLELQRRSIRNFVEPHCFAQVYIALGRFDEAIRLANAAIVRNDLGFPAMSNSPLLRERTQDRRIRELFDDVRKLCSPRRRKTG